MSRMQDAEDMSIQNSREVLFVDCDVADSHMLLEGLARPMEALHLERGKDPLGQIAQALTSRFGMEQVHILSHGEPGALILAGVRVDSAHLALRQATLNSIGFSLTPGANINLWACYVEVGVVGQTFVENFQSATGANINATTEPVGAKALGGTWSIGTASPFTEEAQKRYPHALNRAWINT